MHLDHARARVLVRQLDRQLHIEGRLQQLLVRHGVRTRERARKQDNRAHHVSSETHAGLAVVGAGTTDAYEHSLR